MKYLIAVKFKDNQQVELYEFESKQERLMYAESLRFRDDVQDVSYSQIEREDDEANEG